jgi:hypothetical protein
MNGKGTILKSWIEHLDELLNTKEAELHERSHVNGI